MVAGCGVDTADGAEFADSRSQRDLRVCFQWLRSDTVNNSPQSDATRQRQHYSAL